MTESDDSRPFKVLRQNAEDFKSVFDADVKQCLDSLDLKLSELLRSPDPSSSGRLNAHMEFSKAKLDIFCFMKDMIVDMGEQWTQHLAEIRDTFVENVEIFLAGTKLEVKEASPATSNRKSLSLKERKMIQNSPTPVSSLYPKLLDTAKNIPVLNSLLPKTDLQDRSSEIQNVTSSPVLKPIRKQTTPPELDSQGQGVRRKNSVRFAEVKSSETVDVDEEEGNDSVVEIVEAPTPVQKRRGRPPANSSAANTPTSLRKAIAVRALQNEVLETTEQQLDTAIESPSRTGRGSRRGSVATPSSAKKSQAATPVKSGRQMEPSSDSSISGDETAAPKPKTRRGVKANAEDLPVTPRSIAKARRGAKSSSSEEAVTPAAQQTPGRRGRRTTVAQPVPEITQAETETPKTGHFPMGLDLTEDLEIFSPVVNLTRSVPRRKTVLLQDVGFTPEVPKSKSKRKTIAGDLDFSSASPSKRLKGTGRASMASEAMDLKEVSDHLEGDNTISSGGNYSPWIPLSDVGGDMPTEPGVYELKVSQAKKPAYIGSCGSLRQQLTLHRLRHASGHKHLDKFVERNAPNVLARYERMPTLEDAKAQEKLRVNSFVALYKTTPAYN